IPEYPKIREDIGMSWTNMVLTLTAIHNYNRARSNALIQNRRGIPSMGVITYNPDGLRGGSPNSPANADTRTNKASIGENGGQPETGSDDKWAVTEITDALDDGTLIPEATIGFVENTKTG